MPERTMPLHAINVVFDGPPGPDGPRFVEVETDDGHGLGVGNWIERDDGLWSLRIEPPNEPQLGLATTRQLLDELRARKVDGKLDYRTFDS